VLEPGRDDHAGEELPDFGARHPPEPSGERREEDALPALFLRLAAKLAQG
jgi:hypothetical protein